MSVSSSSVHSSVFFSLVILAIGENVDSGYDLFDEHQAMMTVKHWSQNPGASSIGKPAIHPATVDLRGKAYE